MTDRALAVSYCGVPAHPRLVLNAGAPPPMGLPHEQTGEGFSAPWNTDVKAGFWIREAPRLRRWIAAAALVASSGAALAGSPMSGGYARASVCCGHGQLCQRRLRRAGPENPLQALVPQQMTAAGAWDALVSVHSRRGGARAAAVPGWLRQGTHRRRTMATYVVRILTEPQYQEAPAFRHQATTASWR